MLISHLIIDMPTCVECKKDDKQRYLLIPGDVRAFICSDCFAVETPKKVITKPNVRKFTRWNCLTHQCGSYNFNMLGRHEMPWCNIILQETNGIIKPKTFSNPDIGGCNGNISRHYYPDWQEEVQRHDNQLHAIKVYTQYQKKYERKFQENKKKSRREFRGKKNAYILARVSSSPRKEFKK